MGLFVECGVARLEDSEAGEAAWWRAGRDHGLTSLITVESDYKEKIMSTSIVENQLSQAFDL